MTILAFLGYVALGLLRVALFLGLVVALLAGLSWLIDNTEWSPPKPPKWVGTVARACFIGFLWAIGIFIAVGAAYQLGGGPHL